MKKDYMEMEDEVVLINKVCEDIRKEQEQILVDLENDFKIAKELFIKKVKDMDKYRDEMIKEVAVRASLEIKKAGYNYSLAYELQSKENEIPLDEWFDSDIHGGNYEIISNELHEEYYHFLYAIEEKERNN
jgi:hypothetical protein